jgi:hypothetical protein
VRVPRWRPLPCVCGLLCCVWFFAVCLMFPPPWPLIRRVSSVSSIMANSLPCVQVARNTARQSVWPRRRLFFR